jgi:hypothetical protein
MTSLPPTLLEQLLTELSTLASVYHKPPESFVGKGRFGADEIQRAAIQEQRQNATDEPIAASVAAARAGANGTAGGSSQNNVENLLDIDFDGAAPASHEQNSAAATPDRVASPAGGQASGGMADMMSMFDAPAASSSSPGAGMGSESNNMNDLMNGFDGMGFGGSQQSEPLPAAMQLQNTQGGGSQPKKDSEDLLGLF